jgi:hypothetical protein
MSGPRYACGRCGTWTCIECGWSRPGASALYPDQSCIKCPSREGTLIPTMHTERMWRQHNGDGALPEPYAYGERPTGDLVAPFGRRTANAGPEFYRGVRVPVTGPYARLDVESFKRGVDAALDQHKGENR